MSVETARSITEAFTGSEFFVTAVQLYKNSFSDSGFGQKTVERILTAGRKPGVGFVVAELRDGRSGWKVVKNAQTCAAVIEMASRRLYAASTKKKPALAKAPRLQLPLSVVDTLAEETLDGLLLGSPQKVLLSNMHLEQKKAALKVSLGL